MAVPEAAMVKCACGREWNSAKLEKCPSCGGTSIAGGGAVAPVPAGLAGARISTLPFLAGFIVVENLGIVTALTSNSGWTASSKGNSALDNALASLRDAAGRLGANAVLGVSTAAFGAHGGITSGFGGDAVGVLLIGSAVKVRREGHAD